MSNSEAGKGDNVVKRTNYKKFWDNYPDEWNKDDMLGEVTDEDVEWAEEIIEERENENED